ncbi:MAG: NUDIX hydrolase [Gammaproteobacteria bacterium]|nr:NUDIX hydrolase [Gammaproteobacteria bacterium]NND39369.1 NUDIX hydrolase [Pseudomonadales bacterium]NNM10516.1 NUDIX hydrolase [Pseudomonadales bacterium]
MSEVIIHPSATVVLLHDDADGIKTLLLKRNAKVSFGGGEWVFPGGKIEAAELEKHADDAERVAAVRECKEEAGILLTPDALQKYSHWVTPDFMPKRFSTGFYLAQLDNQLPVLVDNSEIVDYRWVSPAEALAQYARGELPMMPPTFVSLNDFVRFQATSELLQHCQRRDPLVFEPRMLRHNERVYLLYSGDCAYESADASTEGRRHRLLMSESGYEYICDQPI